MVTLKNDTLSFTFPEIARRVRSLVEQRIQELIAELPPDWDRAELTAPIESNPRFSQLRSAAQESARAKLQTWAPADVEAALREVILNRGSLNTDSFTELTIKFQRTMRIPDDGKTYALPTGLGQLPLRWIDDFPETAPASWMKKGGVIMPLNQSEALWIWLSSRYQFAVKIGVGEMNVVSGVPWDSDLQRQPQNYVVVPNPPWEEPDEVVRRYVATPLGAGNSDREQPPGKTNGSGIQFQVTPMRAEDYYRHENAFLLPPTINEFFMRLIFARVISEELDEIERRHSHWDLEDPIEKSMAPLLGERRRQKIHEDQYEFAEWDQTQTARSFVHTRDSLVWRQITGANPPHPPLTAKEYEEAGVPWLDFYRDNNYVEKSNDLG